MLLELSHLQEVVDQLEKHTADPFTLPPASEQVQSLTLLSLVSNLLTGKPFILFRITKASH